MGKIRKPMELGVGTANGQTEGARTRRTLAYIPRRGGKMLLVKTFGGARIKPLCESRVSLLSGTQPQDDVHRKGGPPHVYLRRVNFQCMVGQWSMSSIERK